MKSHIAIVHEKLLQHVCHICSKAFGRKHILKRHIEAVHEKLRNIKCEFCNKMFGVMRAMKAHVLKFHIEKTAKRREYNCDTCGAVVTNLKDLNLHLKTHLSVAPPLEFACSSCTRSYATAHQLKRHKYSAHDKRVEALCHICSKVFGLYLLVFSIFCYLCEFLRPGAESTLKSHLKSHKNTEGPKDKPEQIESDEEPLIKHVKSFSCFACGKEHKTKKSCDAHEETCRLHIQIKLNEKSNWFNGEENVSDLEDEEIANDQIEENFPRHFEEIPSTLPQNSVVKEELHAQENSNLESIEFQSVSVEFVCLNVKEEPEQLSSLAVSFLEEAEVKIEREVNDETLVENPYIYKSGRYHCKFCTSILKSRSNIMTHYQQVHLKIIQEEKCEFLEEEASKFDKNVGNRELKTELSDEDDLLQELYLQIPDQGETEKPKKKTQPRKVVSEKLKNGNNSSKTCILCDPPKTFRRTYLQRHIDAKHNNGVPKYTCEFCNRGFSFKKSRDYHVQVVHEKKRDHKCAEEGCDKEYGNKLDLRQHMIKAHNQGDMSELTCFQCVPPKAFNHCNYLKKHINAMHNEKEFSCDICGKEFSFKSRLQSHLHAIHGKQKEKRTSNRNEELSEGKNASTMNSSEDVSSRTCYVCDPPKIYNHYNYLRAHNDAKHSDGKQKYKCPICKKGFSFRASMIAHLKSIHVSRKDEKLTNLKSFTEKASTSLNSSPQKTLINSGDRKISDQVQIKLKEVAEELETKAELTEEYLEEDNEEKSFDNFEEDRSVGGDEYKQESSCENDSVPENKPLKKKSSPKSKSNGNKSQKSKGSKSKTPLTCLICSRKFKTKRILRVHLKIIHEGRKDFKCSVEECAGEFSRKHDLTRHMIKMHDQGSKDNESQKNVEVRTCKLCEPPKVFSTLTYLQIHIDAIHKGKQPKFSCSYCQRAFSFKGSFDRHMENIHAQQTYKNKAIPTCNDCGKEFASKERLYTHRKTVHMGIPQLVRIKCPICKEIFNSSYLKNKHLAQVHRNGEIKTRTCHVCCTDYELYDDYKAHIDSHEGYFICVTCGHNFIDELSLTLHIDSHRTFDPEFRRFKCDACGYRLASKAQIVVHLRKHFDLDPYVCDVSSLYSFVDLILTPKFYLFIDLWKILQVSCGVFATFSSSRKNCGPQMQDL